MENFPSLRLGRSILSLGSSDFAESAAILILHDKLNAVEFTKENKIDSAPEDVAYCLMQLAHFN